MMEGSIASGMGAAIVSIIIVAVLITAGIFLGAGYFVSKSKYNKGYLQGQLDYQKGIIKIKIDTTRTYRLK